MFGIDHKQFRKEIIKPALMDCVYKGNMLWCADGEEILIATMATESLGGRYLVQEGAPDAVGVFQMQKATYNDLITNYLLPRWKKEIYITDFEFNAFERMKYDLIYAAQMARILYLREPNPLPKYDDLNGMWETYKRWYNSVDGKATKEGFIKKYLEYIRE